MAVNALIVDDEMEICLLLKGMLQKLGFNTQYAHDVKSATQKINESDFETVFVDLNLPDGVGFDLFPNIRDQNNDIKIIVISAYDNEREKSYKKGADYFISKPFSRNTVYDALEQLDVTGNNS